VLERRSKNIKKQRGRKALERLSFPVHLKGTKGGTGIILTNKSDWPARQLLISVCTLMCEGNFDYCDKQSQSVKQRLVHTISTPLQEGMLFAR